MKVVVKVSDNQGQSWAWLLRRRYGKNRRTALSTLVKLAVLEIVRAEAKEMLSEENET